MEISKSRLLAKLKLVKSSARIFIRTLRPTTATMRIMVESLGCASSDTRPRYFKQLTLDIWKRWLFFSSSRELVQSSSQHPVDAKRLIELFRQKLDEDLDHNCRPFGNCRSYGAPFKVTCARYGYSLVGKGTTSRLWNEVSREAGVYHILQKVQWPAVPVFLGSIDLAQTYFLHGAGQIRHLLLMALGGESTSKLKQQPEISQEVSRSINEIRRQGNYPWRPQARKYPMRSSTASNLDH